jgi:hypothetical protein
MIRAIMDSTPVGGWLGEAAEFDFSGVYVLYR